MEKSCRHLLYPFDWRDLLAFMAGFLPFGGTAIAGVLLAGYGWTLWIWLGYAIFFFIVWEGRVLCSHCPYWGKEGRILHCPANYGVPKLWRYHPEPMSRSEGRQFLMGASLLVLLPMIPMAMRGQCSTLAALLTVCGTILAVVAPTFLARPTTSLPIVRRPFGANTPRCAMVAMRTKQTKNEQSR